MFDFVVGNAAVQIRPIVFVRSAVPVNADDGCFREKGAQGFFDALRAVADGGQVLVAAVGAFVRNGFAVVAVVAAQLTGRVGAAPFLAEQFGQPKVWPQSPQNNAAQSRAG